MKIKEYTKYVCEVCGKEYATEKEARECEKKCVFAGKKEERLNKIREEMDRFNEDYPGEYLYVGQASFRQSRPLVSEIEDVFQRIMGA